MSLFVAPPFDEELAARLLALNNRHAEKLSYKSEEEFRTLISSASLVRAEPQGLALLVCFDETGDYTSPNFLWFKARFPRFLYIDRVVVDEQARGRGLASMLYSDAADTARKQGRERLVCEINFEPSNPASDAFHAKSGFSVIGQQRLANGKHVRYWERRI